MEDFSAVNWIAVIVGTILSFLIGWLWYSPTLFGTKWAQGSGVELADANQMPVFALVSQFIALFILATVVGVTATINALFTAILAILAAAAFVAAAGAFVRKSQYAISVEIGYVVVAGAVMIICQGVFRKFDVG